MALPLYLAELTAYVPATASTTTLRYASGQGFVTGGSETPASTWYDARIKQPVNIPRHLFGAGKLSGRSRVSYGDLVLWNPDGALDALLGYGLAGRSVTIRRGEVGDAYPSGFSTLFTGTMEQVEVVGDTLVVKMRDKQADLDVPLQPVKYAGSNALPAGLEGVANDLKGKPKPICLGQVQNVPAPCVNTARLIYQVADRAVTVDAAYDSGVPLLAGFPLTERTSGFGASSNVIAVAYGAGVFVAVGNDGKLASSEDGTTWTLRTSGFGTSNISAVAYGDGQFVAVGESGKVSTSPDGTTWTARTSGTAQWIKGIARGNGLWVLGAGGGVIRTSADAVTWAAATSGITDAIYGLAFGAGRFVAVGDNSACTVSNDGATWTPVDTASSAGFLYDVAYAGNLFLAAGGSGIVLTSPDGLTWTDRNVGLGSVSLYGTYAGTTLDGQSSVYVVVGAGGRVATSPDGVTWTTETSGVSASIALWGITFGDGRYVAAGSDGKIYSSGVGAAYASLSQLMDDTETPLAGSVRAYSGTEGTYLRLGASPAGQITVDATEGATAADRTAGQLFVKVLQRAGKVTGDWTAGDITTLDTAASAVCGYWTAEETTAAEALDLITGSVWAWWGPGRDGVYRVQQLTAPSGTAALTVTANDMLRPLARLTVSDETKGLPSWRSIVRYGRNYAVQVGSGGGVSSGGTGSTGSTIGQELTNNTAIVATGSTQPRLLADRFAAVYTVEDYGTAAAIAANAATAIQAAADAAGAAGGGIVDMPAPSYTCTAGLSLTSAHDGVIFRGAGKEATRVLKSFGGDLFTLASASNIQWQGMTLDGQHGTYVGRGCLITGTSDRPEWRDVLFTNFTSEHIHCEADAGRRALIEADFYPGSGQTDCRYVWVDGPDTLPGYRRFVNCIAEAGYFDLDGALDTVFDNVQVGRIELDSACGITSVLGGIWGNSGAAMTIGGTVTRILGVRFSGDVTLDSAMTGVFADNVQTSGTFTNNTAVNACLVRHHPLGVNYHLVDKHKIYSGSTTGGVIRTCRQVAPGDADYTWYPYEGVSEVSYTTTLTATRTVTLSTTAAENGAGGFVRRTAGGAFLLNVGGLINLAQNEWCLFAYNGSSYVIVASGQYFGTGGNLDRGLYVNVTPTSGTTQYGILANLVASSAATSNGIGLYGRAQTVAASFTQTNGISLYAANPAAGSGSTITTAVGLRIESITAGGTNNYAILTGTGRHSFGAMIESPRLLGTGTSHVAGDYALSAGWGNTATVSTVAARDSGGRVSITCNGSGIAANPTVTLTFKDGAWAVAPAISASRGDLNAPTTGFWALTTASTSAPVWTFVGTPVAGTIYVLDYTVVGK